MLISATFNFGHDKVFTRLDFVVSEVKCRAVELRNKRKPEPLVFAIHVSAIGCHRMRRCRNMQYAVTVAVHSIQKNKDKYRIKMIHV
jgi:hypothetical protein